MQAKDDAQYALKNFMPLFILFGCITGITALHQWWYGGDLKEAMRIFMASFFIIFGFFKVINLKGFVQAYRMYDLPAQYISWYAYVYPFIELLLGFAYFFSWNLLVINAITIVLMIISAIGIFNALRKKQTIMCACLGVVFKVPMTYVTLLEDILMALMAATMLFFF